MRQYVMTTFLVTLFLALSITGCGHAENKEAQSPAENYRVHSNTENYKAHSNTENHSVQSNTNEALQSTSSERNVSQNQNGGEQAVNSVLTQRIQVIINGVPYAMRLADTEGARAFREELPKTVTMDDVNGNEKYIELAVSLPTDKEVAGTIRRGDVKLWGAKGLVIFYKDFNSHYSYTNLGHIEGDVDWDALAKQDSVEITFTL
ncbi:MAG: cyclophilin-like fold protein [Veillonella caviae]|nr:cyclophilin-like fold protein [Veillonella caviae]